MGIVKEVLLLLLLLLLNIGSLAESHDLNCTVTCDQKCNISDEMTDVDSDYTFCIMPGHYSLKNTIILYNISDVYIIGIGGMATISCDVAVGMAIIDVQQFWMENITLTGCGVTGEMWDQEIAPTIEQLLNFSNIYNIPSVVGKSLTIAASHNVTLYHVNVQNSMGVGLLALNMIGQCYLSYCTFDGIVDDDNCSQYSDDLRCISGAAMFYLGDLNDIPLPNDNDIIIDNCTFQNSISHSNYVALELSDGIFELNVSLASSNQSVTPLDGSAGLSVIMDRHYTNSRQYITVKNSWFVNNTNFAAGCVFMQVNEYTAFFSINFSNNTFTSCSGSPYGGAMFMMFGYRLQNSFDMADIPLYNSTVTIVDNLFENNSAVWGGGIAIVGAPGQLSPRIPQRSIIINGNFFKGNRAITGFALAIWESSSHGYRRIYGLDICMHDNWFEDNMVIDDVFGLYNHFNTGTMYIESSYVTLTGNIVFYRNRGAILTTRSVIEVKDTGILNITENIALRGAGADLRDGSLFIIKDNATILFHHNFSPLRGGGIHLLNIRGWPLQFRDGCIFYFNEFTYCPTFGQQGCINLTSLYQQGLVRGQVIFDNNDAGINGNAMFGVRLLDCPWFQFDKDNFFNGLNSINHTIIFRPPLGDGDQVDVLSTSRLIVILDSYSPRQVMPGHVVTATVSVVDELQQFSPSGVSLELGLNSPNSFTIDGHTESFIVGNKSKIELRFFGNPNQTVNFSLFSTQSYTLPEIPGSIYLTYCKPGFVFDNNSCKCDPNLLEASGGAISCIKNSSILIPRNLWAGVLKRNGQLEYVVSLCYLQYCDDNTIELQDLTNPEVQCNFHHSGFLCGSCFAGYSDVFGSTRCRQCSNDTIATILLFAFLGVLLVGVLFFGHITVSIGLFNGAILYANAVSLYAFLIYPNNYNPSLNPATVMLAWLNLNLGFELCFYDGMNSLAEVVFRLLFPLYLLFLLVIVIIAIRHTRLAHLISSPVPVLSTIIWLSYSSLFQTSVEILGVVSVIAYPSTDKEVRWLQDPTVQYARGGHLVLFIIALLLMIFVLIPLPLLLLFYHRLTNKFRWLSKMHPFVDAFYGPFKLRYYYWIGVRLLFRMGLVVFGYFGQLLTVSDLRQYFTLLLCFYVCALLVFQSVLQPYRSNIVNVLDTFYLTNLTFLFISAMYFAALGVGRDSSNDRDIQIAHTSVSLGLTLIVFGVVLLWYVLVQLRNYLAQHTQLLSKFKHHHRTNVFTFPHAIVEQLLNHEDNATVENDSKRTSQSVDEEEDAPVQYNRMRESLLSEDGI